jgi:drug/metabolite transporter (DMT)-like permease
MSETPEPRSLKLRADLVLVGVTFVWGSSFIVVRNVLRDAPPLAFLFWRFLFASCLIALALHRRPKSPGVLRDGLVAGILLAAGMSLQVIGQLETTASKAAFLTGLSVVLTPFAAYARTHHLPSLENGIGIALASAGFFLLTFPTGTTVINRGDLFMVACGVVFAFYIVELALRSGSHDPVRLTAIQLLTVALVGGVLSLLLRSPLASGVAAAAAEARPLRWSAPFVGSVLYLASIGTVGTFFGQTWAQRHMSATHAAILFALEPVFAALLAAWFLAERLGPRGVAGGALVLVGIVASELRLRRKSTVDSRQSTV